MILAGLVLAALTLSASAQESNRDENGKIVRGPYETNSFWSNWFLSAGGGVDYVIEGVLDGKKDPKGGLTPTLDVNLGKWFDPCFGVRLGYEGYKVKAYNKTMPNNYIHGDVLWNISNQFGGYKDSRFWNFIPYASAGYMFSKDNGQEFAVGVGLLNNLRLCNRLDLFLDIRSSFMRAQQIAGYYRSGLIDASLGLSVDLGKNTWRRGCSAALDAANAANAALTAANKALQDENAKLAAENEALKNAPAKVVTNTEFVKRLLDVTPAALYFEIGRSVLSLKEQQHLDFYLQNVVEENDAKKFTVTGYADAATGNTKINMKLAQARAEYVAKLLQEKGVKAENITIVNGGEVKGEKLELLRSAVVEF